MLIWPQTSKSHNQPTKCYKMMAQMVELMHSGQVFLVSSFTVCNMKFYLNTSHVENVGTSKLAIFLNILLFRQIERSQFAQTIHNSTSADGILVKDNHYGAGIIILLIPRKPLRGLQVLSVLQILVRKLVCIYRNSVSEFVLLEIEFITKIHDEQLGMLQMIFHWKESNSL